MGHYATDKDRHPSHSVRTGNRQSNDSRRRYDFGRKRRGRSQHPRGKDQEFVVLDGEGIENDYVLLDSSSTYDRLYTGQRLGTRACLDWVWAVASSREASSRDLAVYGAGYDFNNWMRDLDFGDVVKLAKGRIVRFADYSVLWQQGYRFEIRKQAERVPRGNYSAEAAVIWDVLPFWQTKFTKAVEKTLGSCPELITAGKDARGSFTHDNIEWVSEYNKLECSTTVEMMRNLVQWLDMAGLRLISWNGPGAIAKALLREHRTFLHAGREVNGHTSSGVGPYTHPDELSEAMLSAYAGGRNQILQVGDIDLAYLWDIISAYPFATLSLPCLSHGEWKRVSRFVPHSFGFWKINYSAKIQSLTPIYPFFHRDRDGGIHYPSYVCDRWAYTEEVAAALAYDRAGVEIEYGWVWQPGQCDNPRPFSWVAQSFQQRKQYKKQGLEGASTAIKLGLNSVYGSLAQARGGYLDSPPWSQQLLWAAAITATIRARLHRAAVVKPWTTCHMATDAIISTEPIPLRLSEQLGDWEVKELHDCTFVQYGVYFSREKNRTRGFSAEGIEASEFLDRVHSTWSQSGYRDIWYDVNYFVGCGLVAEGLAPYEEWCHWKTRQEKLSTHIEDNYCYIEQPRPGQLVRVQEDRRMLDLCKLGSESYTPKWGKGESFEDDLFEDAISDGANA